MEEQSSSPDNVTNTRVVTIHMAGLDCRVSNTLRQRCAWCGAVLCDYRLDRIAVPVDQSAEPPIWAPGQLVAIDGVASWAVEAEPSEQDEKALKIPQGACFGLDPDITGEHAVSSILTQVSSIPCTMCQGELMTPDGPFVAVTDGNGWRHDDLAQCRANIYAAEKKAGAHGPLCQGCGEPTERHPLQVGPLWCDGQAPAKDKP